MNTKTIEDKLDELVARESYYQSLINAAYTKLTFDQFATQEQADKKAARLRVILNGIGAEIKALLSSRKRVAA